VPYEVDGESKAMYPDFLVPRLEGDGWSYIVYPHSKAAGLAKYASLHADRFGRIELVMAAGSATKRRV
jgi:hypothetical protein